MKVSASLPVIAAVVAFLMAIASVLSALNGRLLVLPFALIPLASGIGILRRRVWSSYGFALFQLAQILLVPVLLIRSFTESELRSKLLWSAAADILIAVLFYLSGRSLAASGAVKGRAFPWIAASVLCTAPLIFVQTLRVPSGGMEDTLLIGDFILAQSFPKTMPKRGDIVAFRFPIDNRQIFLKRIIGIPGDRIRISNGIVYVNGRQSAEPYATHKFNSSDPYGKEFPSKPSQFAPVRPPGLQMLAHDVVNGEVIVPVGKYFVLGDNRDASFDSRYWGFVGVGDIIGRPFLIYDSEAPAASGQANRPLSRVRWNRLFKLI